MLRTLAVLVVLASVFIAGGLLRPQEVEAGDAGAASDTLRTLVLSRRILAEVPRSGEGVVRGGVMDWSIRGGLVTLVAIDDGSVSLYYSSGGGIIGAGSHPTVSRAAAEFRREAAAQMKRFQEVTEFPPPSRGSVMFYVLTDSATFTSGTITEDEIMQRNHPLYSLGMAAQAVIGEIRQTM